MFGYVGELCRYLMNVEPNEDDKNHNLRVISGNGLRPDIWEKFQSRFGVVYRCCLVSHDEKKSAQNPTERVSQNLEDYKER